MVYITKQTKPPFDFYRSVFTHHKGEDIILKNVRITIETLDVSSREEVEESGFTGDWTIHLDEERFNFLDDEAKDIAMDAGSNACEHIVARIFHDIPQPVVDNSTIHEA